MNLKLSNEIKAEALRLGFFSCGIAKAEPVDEATATEIRQWLCQEKYAGMAYMNNHTEKRLNPCLLMPGVKSIISVALNYTPAQRIKEDEYQVACYAYGQDYHDIVKNKLRELARSFGFLPYEEKSTEDLLATNPDQLYKTIQSNDGKTTNICPQCIDENASSMVHFRAFCDSAPVLERYWAVKAGLGWTGKNHQLIIPKAGSMFVLGELFLDIELTYDEEMPNRCGSCRRCIDACPTSALGNLHAESKEYRHFFDASLCLSYQTIENRGDLSSMAKQAIGNNIYGCDKCQTACPWNRFSPSTTIEELHPNPALLTMTKEKWENLSEKDYQFLFKGSAVKRAKYAGLVRNIKAVSGKNEETKKRS